MFSADKYFSEEKQCTCKKKHILFEIMVPLARIGLATPSLPMTCSTTELQRRQRKETYTPFKKKSSIIL